MSISPAQERYHSYLQSEYWQKVTHAVKQRADFRCQLCNSQHGLQAHHRTYEHRGNELEHLNDLTCLCSACHELFHKRHWQSEGAEGMAKAEQRRADELVMVEVTKQNHYGIKSHKRAWHWMMANGYNPRLKGWRKRAIGNRIPAFCFNPVQAAL